MFDAFLALPETHGVPYVAVENPIPLTVAGLPPHTQEVQPYQHGHPYSKATRLWLRGLPPLRATRVMRKFEPYVRSSSGIGGSAKTKQQRSKTFAGIARAMAKQWGDVLLGTSTSAESDSDSEAEEKGGEEDVVESMRRKFASLTVQEEVLVRRKAWVSAQRAANRASKSKKKAQVSPDRYAEHLWRVLGRK